MPMAGTGEINHHNWRVAWFLGTRYCMEKHLGKGTNVQSLLLQWLVHWSRPLTSCYLLNNSFNASSIAGLWANAMIKSAFEPGGPSGRSLSRFLWTYAILSLNLDPCLDLLHLVQTFIETSCMFTQNIFQGWNCVWWYQIKQGPVQIIRLLLFSAKQGRPLILHSSLDCPWYCTVT